MLFPYKYINHEVEKFQKYSDFLFLEVWCKASKAFSSKALMKMSELKLIYERLHNEDSAGARFFNGHIETIYEDFRHLDKKDRDVLKSWYKLNNDISGLCKDRSLQPISYDKLIHAYPDLGKKIKSFYTKLYGSGSPFDLVAFGDFRVVIFRHYVEFMQINDEEICPFCGINSIKGVNHTKREAYDHFIPKAQYPFTSVNFKNLAPMCHECNSSYKLSKEPLMHIDPITKKTLPLRRRAFYPYSSKKWDFQTKVELTKTDIENLTPTDINITFKTLDSYSHLDQIESWNETFGIDERYKAKILGKRGAKKWFAEFLEIENMKKLEPDKEATAKTLYEMKMKEINADPLDNGNFIKKAFLEECTKKGLLNLIP
jgi:hypothetical protein